MKERPILFKGDMVRAILNGRKTQTRRIIKGQSDEWEKLTDEEDIHGNEFFVVLGKEEGSLRPILTSVKCPYGHIGDRLWVRETWNTFDPWVGVFYAADDHSYGIGDDDDADHIEPHDIRWRPSIHMPRWASRILLEVTDVRVERLKDISEEDAISEGIYLFQGEGGGYKSARGEQEHDTAVEAYADLWERINGPGSWDANPWVWVVSFKTLEVRK